MQETRQQILDHLRVTPEATVRELGEVLDLTATGVRQHLTLLEQGGFVTSREVRGKVGRPALVYSLTTAGEESYSLNYDLLAGVLLEEVRSSYGTTGFQRVIRGVAERMAAPHLQRFEGTTPEQRMEEACALLREQNVVADWEADGDAFLLHERTCPYPVVARQNSAMCVIDIAYTRALTGMDARLVECRVRGDGGCTYRLQPSAVSA
ncbi:MAG: helix-turn-helix domain-containing protein [Dehalococcoidia bacterium]|jgi:predicted ArsR family transcriptional regulator|nr:helix-turn-helix domain-containing protein [Dehalococcoidia bacterium]